MNKQGQKSETNLKINTQDTNPTLFLTEFVIRPKTAIKKYPYQQQLYTSPTNYNTLKTSASTHPDDSTVMQKIGLSKKFNHLNSVQSMQEKYLNAYTQLSGFKFGFPELNNDDLNEYDQSFKNQTQKIDRFGESLSIKGESFNLSSDQPNYIQLFQYQFRYFKIHLKNRQQPLSIFFRVMEGPLKYKMMAYLSMTNENPSVFNTQLIYENRLKICVNEPNTLPIFTSEYMYLSLHTDFDMKILVKVKFFLIEKDREEMMNADQKIQQFLKQKNEAKITTEQKLDNKSLQKEVEMILERRKQQNMNSNHVKRNKKVKFFQPQIKDQIRRHYEQNKEINFQRVQYMKNMIYEEKHTTNQNKITEKNKKHQELVQLCNQQPINLIQRLYYQTVRPQTYFKNYDEKKNQMELELNNLKNSFSNQSSPKKKMSRPQTAIKLHSISKKQLFDSEKISDNNNINSPEPELEQLEEITIEQLEDIEEPPLIQQQNNLKQQLKQQSQHQKVNNYQELNQIQQVIQIQQ